MEVEKPRMSLKAWAKDRATMLFIVLSFFYNLTVGVEMVLRGQNEALLFLPMAVLAWIAYSRFQDYIESFNLIMSKAFIVSVSAEEFEEIRRDTDAKRVLKKPVDNDEEV